MGLASLGGGLVPTANAISMERSMAAKVSGVLSVYDTAGISVATLDGVVPEACDGVVVAKGQAYMVAGSRVLALACAPPN